MNELVLAPGAFMLKVSLCFQQVILPTLPWQFVGPWSRFWQVPTRQECFNNMDWGEMRSYFIFRSKPESRFICKKKQQPSALSNRKSDIERSLVTYQRRLPAFKTTNRESNKRSQRHKSFTRNSFNEVGYHFQLSDLCTEPASSDNNKRKTELVWICSSPEKIYCFLNVNDALNTWHSEKLIQANIKMVATFLD